MLLDPYSGFWFLVISGFWFLVSNRVRVPGHWNGAGRGPAPQFLLRMPRRGLLQNTPIALAPRCEAANWIAIESHNSFNEWRRGHEPGHPKTMGSFWIGCLVNPAPTQHERQATWQYIKQINTTHLVHIHFATAALVPSSTRPCIATIRLLPPLRCVCSPPRSSRGLPSLLLPARWHARAFQVCPPFGSHLIQHRLFGTYLACSYPA